METKRFIGNDMRRLYERVREEFGPDAIIVRTRSLMREGAEPLIELLAAPPHAEPELALDLQWKMVDGALGRLQIARQHPTIGDLEDIAARESAGSALPQLVAPGVQPEPQQPAEWFQGFVSNEAPSRTSDGPIIGLGGFDEERRIPFGGLDEIEDEAPPSHEWATRTRPQAPSRAQRPRSRGAGATRSGSVADELLAAGLSPEAVDRIVAAVPGEGDALQSLAGALARLDVRFPDELQTALVTIQGPAGAGRTTALMRMALDCADAGREAVLVAADTTRAAARDQLYAYADATGLSVFDAAEPSQLVGLAGRLPRGACLFVDVPAGPWAPPQVLGDTHYTYLALPAYWQAGALERQLRAYALGGFSGCVITGGDLATDLSPVVSVAVQSALGIAFLSSGRDISTGIETVDPVELASGILRVTSGDRTDGRVAASA